MELKITRLSAWGAIVAVKFRLELLGAFLTLALSLGATSADAIQGTLGASCHLPGYDQPLRCVSLAVPIDYQHPQGARLNLHVTVAPAFREAASSDPLFILAGGPGQAGSELLPLLDTTFRKVRATRDIIFIDQRGTGLSGKLDCESVRSLAEQSLPEQEKALEDCLHSLKQPFGFYNTDNSARDLEQIRKALAYGRINIWGASYGTRLAQAYARLFGGSTRALILDGVASPDQIIFAWGRDGQAALDGVFRHCAEDPPCHKAFPSLREQFKSIQSAVSTGTVKLDFPHPRTAMPVRLDLPLAKFQQTIRSALYTPATRSRLPFLIDSAGKGNWRPFVAQMYGTTDISVDGPSVGLMLSVTCAEDIPRLKPETIKEEERSSFLVASEIKLVSGWCRFVNVPAIAYREPSVITVPVLLLSGTLDPVTPPRRAQSAARHMVQAQHFVVANAGHGISQLGCAPRLLREFLDRPAQALDAKCLDEIPQTSFQLGAAGPQP